MCSSDLLEQAVGIERKRDFDWAAIVEERHDDAKAEAAFAKVDHSAAHAGLNLYKGQSRRGATRVMTTIHVRVGLPETPSGDDLSLFGARSGSSFWVHFPGPFSEPRTYRYCTSGAIRELG